MKRALLALALVLAVPMIAIAQDAAAPASMSTHVAFTPSDLKWGPAPPGLPTAATAAVLQGNPGEAGQFTVRLKLPANTKVMPHFHPTDENVTVISGQFLIGMGDTFDQKSMKPMPQGSFTVLPATMHHYAMAKTACVVQVHGMGPFGITYVNPSDDPRNAPTATK
ncbi:MAG TPA: cupin domain-containing protein [Candidatus Eisenbacteria bacterium]|nr:cupin domain-containing protein [Candidatus Eisenbacteria bacterium]